MSAEFRANIEENESGQWHIRILDIDTNEYVICEDLEMFSREIEIMGSEYGGEISVVWSKDENVSEANFHDINKKMEKIQQELNESK